MTDRGPRVLGIEQEPPADWKQCACPTRKGRRCPIEADRVWEGMNVCHVHDPDGKSCAMNQSSREYAIAALTAAKAKAA